MVWTVHNVEFMKYSVCIETKVQLSDLSAITKMLVFLIIILELDF